MELEAIAAISMEQSLEEASLTMETAMLKKTMDLEQALAAELLKSLANAIPAPPPSFGHKLDVLA